MVSIEFASQSKIFMSPLTTLNSISPDNFVALIFPPLVLILIFPFKLFKSESVLSVFIAMVPLTFEIVKSLFLITPLKLVLKGRCRSIFPMILWSYLSDIFLIRMTFSILSWYTFI